MTGNYFKFKLFIDRDLGATLFMAMSVLKLSERLQSQQPSQLNFVSMQSKVISMVSLLNLQLILYATQYIHKIFNYIKYFFQSKVYLFFCQQMSSPCCSLCYLRFQFITEVMIFQNFHKDFMKDLRCILWQMLKDSAKQNHISSCELLVVKSWKSHFTGWEEQHPIS